jgi:hypothetical protein
MKNEIKREVFQASLGRDRWPEGVSSPNYSTVMCEPPEFYLDCGNEKAVAINDGQTIVFYDDGTRGAV